MSPAELVNHHFGTNDLAVPVDQYYLPSWNVCLICIILFVGLCNIAFIVLRYRLKIPDAAKLGADQILWIRKWHFNRGDHTS